jgi:serine/threonine protein kinase
MERVHDAGVLHRDLKPANVFVLAPEPSGGAGEPRSDLSAIKVLDFGVARATVRDPSGRVLETLAPPGFTVGTPQYMSPEQSWGEVDERADIYSLGAILYEAVAGRLPVTIVKARHRSVPLMRRLPRLSALVDRVDPRLDRLLYDMLQPDREKRPRTMGEVRVRLQELGT